MVVDDLEFPIVLAPMGGGPSTVALAEAVGEAGGLGFLAAGYLSAAQMADDIEALRGRRDRPFGINLFVPNPASVDADAIARYLNQLADETRRYNAALGEPRYDDDDWSAKLDVIREQRPAVVSFTFGCPASPISDELRRLGVEVWVTVTTPEEADFAQEVGASALVVQGTEAGGHRGGFSDPDPGEGYGLLALLRLISSRSELPLIAAGGVGDGAALAGALCAGASAGQLGSAFLLAEEAGTHPAHRRALRAGRPTALTRAFSGRYARGIVNRFLCEHASEAPSAYPHIHHATGPLRAAARAQDDADGFNLWAGQAHHLAQARPAQEIVRTIASDAGQILDATRRALQTGRQD